MPFSMPLTDAAGTCLDKPMIGECDLVVRKGGTRTIIDWKTSTRRCPKDKASTDLQATCDLWAEQHRGRPSTQFRFDGVTKTKSPVCEQHRAMRSPEDFARVGELVRILERIVANDCRLPRRGSWECANCPYAKACKAWHRERAWTFVRAERPEAA